MIQKQRAGYISAPCPSKAWVYSEYTTLKVKMFIHMIKTLQKQP